jgi:phosphatidate cytidylyltransferase
MLRLRVITALALLGGFLAAVFWLPFSGWVVFAAGVGAISGWEWAALIRLDVAARRVYAVATMAGCLALGFSVFAPGDGEVVNAPLLATVLFLGVAYWLVAVPGWLGRNWQLPGGLGGGLIGWLVLVPACVALMQLRAIGPWFLLAAMATVWMADIAAYFTGRAIGRHKLAPSISPGKTWEGAGGALAGVWLFGFAVAAASGRLDAWNPAGYALFAAALGVLTAVSIAGDLFESLVKRQAGVKDSGTLLPGHGGVLDRIDSLTSTLPLVGLGWLFLDGRFQW